MSDSNYATLDPLEAQKRSETAEKLQQQATAKQLKDEATAFISKWERQMQKLFKGIIPRPERHKQLRIAAAQEPPKPSWDTSNPKGRPHTRQDNPRKRRGPGGGGKRKAGRRPMWEVPVA